MTKIITIILRIGFLLTFFLCLNINVFADTTNSTANGLSKPSNALPAKKQKSKPNTKNATAPANKNDKLKKVSDQVTQALNSLSSKNSALENRMNQEHLVANNPFGVSFYRPNYILPFYYTGSPYQAVYAGNTPNNQKVKSAEFKAQFSFKFPVFNDILGEHSSLNAAYTQLMYWQFYTSSQYFRETDYEPELFISKRIVPNWWVNVGVDHQSNGRGGAMERSWNRAYMNVMFSSDKWLISLRPWVLIFKNSSSNLHNPDIEHYMGHGDVTFSYKLNPVTLSIMTRNNIESGFRRGSVEFDCSFPIYRFIKGYVQFFSGYGQSLIEYNHHTNSAGIGIALGDWI